MTTDEERRIKQIKEKYGARAQHVAPYKPNRKQKRAQQAAAKAQARANKRNK